MHIHYPLANRGVSRGAKESQPGNQKRVSFLEAASYGGEMGGETGAERKVDLWERGRGKWLDNSASSTQDVSRAFVWVFPKSSGEKLRGRSQVLHNVPCPMTTLPSPDREC